MAGPAGALHRKMEAEGSAVSMAKKLGTTEGMFQSAAESNIPPLKPTKGSPIAQKVAQAKKVEEKRKSLLGMTPAERYLRGVGLGAP